jgi:hypothetical protein
MAESPVPPPASRPLRREDRQLIYMVLLACWLAMAAYGIYAFKPYFAAKAPPMSPPPFGHYVTIKEYVAALTFKTNEDQTVSLAGVSDEDLDEAARVRAGARLRELAPVGTVVFIEPNLGSTIAGKPSVRAAAWLPPPGVKETYPFPYEESRLLAATLVQEGLVRVDESQGYVYTNELLMVEDDARRHERGLWAPK